MSLLLRKRPKGKTVGRETVRREDLPASRAIIFICEKCGKGADFSSKDLKNEIRSLIKQRGQKGEVRIALSSCLDVCPKDGITVLVAATATSTPPECFVARGEAADGQICH